MNEKRSDAQRLRAMKHALADLTTTVTACLAAYDYVLTLPPTVHRGRQLAAVSNTLDMANDSALHFGLGTSFAAIRRGKNAATQHAQAARERRAMTL